MKENMRNKRFTVYDCEDKTVLELINKLGTITNGVQDSLDNKTDLYGDHKGSWQGLNRPTMSEEGMRATVEDIIDNKIPSIETSLEHIENKENWVSVLDYGAKCDGVSDDSIALQNAINDINTITTPKGQWKRTLYIPSKLRITKEISIPFGQFKIMGNSLNNSQIFLDGVHACLNFDGTNYRHEIEFEDIRIKGNDTNNVLIKMNKVMNIYFTRVDLSNHGDNKYAIEFTDCGIYSFDKCIIQGGSDLTNGGSRRGIKETQNNIGLGSIINITGCNLWNLNEFMSTNGSVQKLNIHDNWCECVKKFLTINSVDDMRYTNISIRDNFFNNHNEGGYIITEYCFIDVVNTTNTDWFGGIISIDNNTFYLWDLTNIKGNSLINMNTIKSNTELSINYNTNTFSGRRLDQLNAYVFNTKNVTNFLNSVYFRNVSTCLRVDTTSITDKKEIITSSMNLPNKKFGSPNGFYFSNSETLNDGNIFYENGAFYVGVGGTIKAMPKKSSFTLSTVDTETANANSLAVTVNGILNALVQAQIINLE